jgi:hypothetical protein
VGQRERALDHLLQQHRLERHRRGAAEGAEVRDYAGRLPHLVERFAEVVLDLRLLDRAELDAVDGVRDEEPDVVQRVVQLVRDTGGQLAERRQLARLHELFLLLAELLLAALHLERRLAQVVHDVDHRLAAALEPEIGVMRVLEDVDQGPPRAVEPRRLLGEPAAVGLVVDEDVEHRPALVGEAPVRLVEVAHDVQQRAAALFCSADSLLELLHLLAQALVRLEQLLCLPGGRGTVGCGRLGGHQAEVDLSFSTSPRRVSSSFSSAIIFSSRPTTTSSNFSRSRIFSWSSALDSSRSRTTSS